MFETLVREGDLRARRVLDIGCGTGALAAALTERAACRVWGVDPSPEMLAQARARGGAAIGLKEGRGERLPFKDGWFERAVMSLVVHLIERPRSFAEARRVLAHAGRLAIVTFDPSHFGDYWLNRLFPSMEAIDRARFPTPEQLDAELEGAGFAQVRRAGLSLAVATDRAQALEKIAGRHISTFDLIDDDEYRAGRERAERELPERIEYRRELLIVTADAA